mmetsp:Transcript_52967/g.113574  ORF Transcript_52967/g.113574 Transcript_52967/m.113574 type:complete len:228 (+) Transcript_52967:344-1027(+)
MESITQPPFRLRCFQRPGSFGSEVWMSGSPVPPSFASSSQIIQETPFQLPNNQPLPLICFQTGRKFTNRPSTFRYSPCRKGLGGTATHSFSGALAVLFAASSSCRMKHHSAARWSRITRIRPRMSATQFLLSSRHTKAHFETSFGAFPMCGSALLICATSLSAFAPLSQISQRPELLLRSRPSPKTCCQIGSPLCKRSSVLRYSPCNAGFGGATTQSRSGAMPRGPA